MKDKIICARAKCESETYFKIEFPRQVKIILQNSALEKNDIFIPEHSHN